MKIPTASTITEALIMYSVFNKRIVACVLALIMLLGTLVACTDSNGGEAESTASEPSDVTADGSDEGSDGGDADGEKIVLASNGKSDFTIWVASDIFSGYQDIAKQITDVASLIKNKTGADVLVKSDSSYSVREAKKAGILIGNTRFAESKSVGAEMKAKDYYVGASGNKILIYGGDVDGVSKAVRYFYITVLNGQKVVDKTLVFDTAVHTLYQTDKYGIDSILCDGTELMSFKLVIPADADVTESYFASSLRCWLYEEYGFRMPIVDDKTQETENEVLIGRVSRSGITSPDENGYSVRVADGKLYLNANGMLGYSALYDYLTETLLRSGSSASYTLTSANTVSASATLELSDGSALAASRTGDVRIMSYNLFSGIVNYDDGTSTGPVELRQKFHAEIIRTFAPDVVALQEYSTNYEAFTSVMTSLGYTLVSVSSEARNQVPLFYNADVLTLVDSGYLGYTGIDAQKAACWAVFEVKATGKKFISISTHFMWNSPKLTLEEAVEARNDNARELLALVAEIRSRSDFAELPVTMSGDFNCQLDSTALQSIKQGGFSCAWDEAAQKNNTSGYHQYSRYDAELETYLTVNSPKPSDTHYASIDHTFVSSGLTVNSFAAVTTLYALLASDHCPIITDITLN